MLALAAANARLAIALVLFACTFLFLNNNGTLQAESKKVLHCFWIPSSTWQQSCFRGCDSHDSQMTGSTPGHQRVGPFVDRGRTLNLSMYHSYLHKTPLSIWYTDSRSTRRDQGCALVCEIRVRSNVEYFAISIRLTYELISRFH